MGIKFFNNSSLTCDTKIIIPSKTRHVLYSNTKKIRIEVDMIETNDSIKSMSTTD